MIQKKKLVLREGSFPALTEDGRFSLETASNATNTVSTLRISNLDFRERAPQLNQTAVERVESALVISHKLFLFLRSIACEVMANMFINKSFTTPVLSWWTGAGATPHPRETNGTPWQPP